MILTLFRDIVVCLQNKPRAVYQDIQVERGMLQYELDVLNDMTNVSYERIVNN